MTSIIDSIADTAKNFRNTNHLSRKETIAVLESYFPRMKETCAVIANEVFDWHVENDIAVEEAAEEVPKVTKVSRLPQDEYRCCARTFNIEKHREFEPLLIFMRDDLTNAFGDRCCRKSSVGSFFCGQHLNKQSHGVWNGPYTGGFRMLYARTCYKMGKIDKEGNIYDLEYKKIIGGYNIKTDQWWPNK